MNEYASTAPTSNGQAVGRATGPMPHQPSEPSSPAALLDSLPRIESAVVEFLNIIFRNERRIGFEWPDGSACTVGLLSGFTHRLPGNQNAELVIDAWFGRHQVSIGLESTGFLELLDGENAALLPPELKCALLESYLDNAARQFEQAGGQLIRIAAVGHAPKALTDRGNNLFFELFQGQGLSATAGYISWDRQGLGRLAGILNEKDPPPSWDRVADLLLPVAFILGSTRLRCPEISNLASEDIVLLDGIITENGQATPMRVDLAGSPFWMAKMDGNRLVVEEKVERSMEEKTNLLEREDEDVTDLEDIELVLVFELGRKSMSLAEIRRIGPGHIFDLAGELSNPVSILINGGRIGSGELIKIDNRLGVRLTHRL